MRWGVHHDVVVSATCDKILDNLVDPMVLEGYYAMGALLHFSLGDRVPWFHPILSKLASRGYECAPHIWSSLLGSEDVESLQELLPARIRFILEMSPEVITGTIDETWCEKFLALGFGCGGPRSSVVVEVLSIFIEKGDEINARNGRVTTPSMTARNFGYWKEWSRALEQNGKHIKEVLRNEGNEWLEREDWTATWIERHRDLVCYGYYKVEDEVDREMYDDSDDEESQPARSESTEPTSEQDMSAEADDSEEYHEQRVVE